MPPGVKYGKTDFKVFHRDSGFQSSNSRDHSMVFQPAGREGSGQGRNSGLISIISQAV